ncbi:MAG: DUF416 family protein [Terriglobales bacterium]
MNPQVKTNEFEAFLERLEARLVLLPTAAQMAFSASCCERAYPNYELFCNLAKWGDPSVFRNSLDLIWETVTNAQPSHQLLGSLEQSCLKATPDLDNFAVEELDVAAAAAQDAAFMITLLLQWAKNDGSGYAKRIATFSRDTIDTYVQAREKISATDPTLEQRIANHPLMLRELHRQALDLQHLEQKNNRSNLEQFRAHAMLQSANISAL